MRLTPCKGHRFFRLTIPTNGQYYLLKIGLRRSFVASITKKFTSVINCSNYYAGQCLSLPPIDLYCESRLDKNLWAELAVLLFNS
jgi:hypothetical protein